MRNFLVGILKVYVLYLCRRTKSKMCLVNIECFIFVTLQCLTCAIFFECERNGAKCCANYYEVNGVCSECPAGTFGLNCTGRCLPNFYGQLCKKECHCHSYQYCDPVHGCKNNSHSTNGNNIPCAVNFFIVNGHCTECPKGKFGVNCNKTCPKNYFGRLCKDLCYCSTDQYCDMVNGCLQNAGYTLNEHTQTSKTTTAVKIKSSNPPQRPGTFKWKTIAIALIGGLLAMLAATGVFCFRSGLKTIEEHCSFSNTAENKGEDSSDQDVELANLGTPTHSSHGHSSEERQEEFCNVYNDLRLSQMVDSNLMAACSEVTLNEDTFDANCKHVSERLYRNSYTMTNNEEDLTNNYEHCRVPSTEYSILSLKRNIEPSVTELYGQRDRGNDKSYDLVVRQVHDISESNENSQSESE
nr:uncharacterized protein LOC117692996 isoform X2 [Crassostrea gigas]